MKQLLSNQKTLAYGKGKGFNQLTLGYTRRSLLRYKQTPSQLENLRQQLKLHIPRLKNHLKRVQTLRTEHVSLKVMSGCLNTRPQALKPERPGQLASTSSVFKRAKMTGQEALPNHRTWQDPNKPCPIDDLSLGMAVISQTIRGTRVADPIQYSYKGTSKAACFSKVSPFPDEGMDPRMNPHITLRFRV